MSEQEFREKVVKILKEMNSGGEWSPEKESAGSLIAELEQSIENDRIAASLTDD